VAQALPHLVSQLKDPLPHIQDTAAWTIGQAIKFVPHGVVPKEQKQMLTSVLAELLQVLPQGAPHVATKCCWAVSQVRQNVLGWYHRHPLWRLRLIFTRDSYRGTSPRVRVCRGTHVSPSCSVQGPWEENLITQETLLSIRSPLCVWPHHCRAVGKVFVVSPNLLPPKAVLLPSQAGSTTASHQPCPPGRGQLTRRLDGAP
jgi:hypothetical protein